MVAVPQRAASNSAALANRSAGSFSNAVSTAALTCSGTDFRCSSGATGSAVVTMTAIFQTLVVVALTAMATITSRTLYDLRRRVREANELGQYALEEKLGMKLNVSSDSHFVGALGASIFALERASRAVSSLESRVPSQSANSGDQNSKPETRNVEPEAL